MNRRILAFGVAVIGLAALSVLALFTDVSAGFLIALAAACVAPGVHILTERTEAEPIQPFQQDAPENAERLASILARRMPGRPHVDLVAGLAAATGALILHVSTESDEKRGPFLAGRILKSFPDCNPEWIAECIEEAERYSASGMDPETEAVHTAEFFLEMLTESGRFSRKILADWMLVLVYELLLFDGRVTAEEDRVFAAIARRMGIRPARVAAIRQRGRQSEKTADGSGSRDRDLFGLAENYSEEDLEHAWRRLARRYHPDRYHGMSEAVYRQANDRFLACRAAYERLQSAIRRP